MLRAIGLVAWQTFTLLRRDKMVRAAVIAGFLTTVLALLASTWSIEDQIKILFDVGFFCFQLVGSIMAIFWGSKSVGDSRQDGAIEWQLAAPISRTSWLLGKYLGLAVSTLLLGAVLLFIWQLGMILGGYGTLSLGQLAVYLLMLLGWLVLLALSLLFSVSMRFSLALFAGVGVWLVGLTSAAVAAALTPETPPEAQAVVRVLARAWDLQAFNLVDRVLEAPGISPASLLNHVGYGIVLIAIFLTVAALASQRGDIA